MIPVYATKLRITMMMEDNGATLMSSVAMKQVYACVSVGQTDLGLCKDLRGVFVRTCAVCL
jgi:hypothetical protein